MLIWLENALVFGVNDDDDDEDITAFTDSIITCSKPIDNQTLLQLLSRQMHMHSHTCREGTKAECHFNYPQPPMKCTRILCLIDGETQTSAVAEHKACSKSIHLKIDVDFRLMMMTTTIMKMKTPINRQSVRSE